MICSDVGSMRVLRNSCWPRSVHVSADQVQWGAPSERRGEEASWQWRPAKWTWRSSWWRWRSSWWLQRPRWHEERWLWTPQWRRPTRHGDGRSPQRWHVGSTSPLRGCLWSGTVLLTAPLPCCPFQLTLCSDADPTLTWTPCADNMQFLSVADGDNLVVLIFFAVRASLQKMRETFVAAWCLRTRRWLMKPITCTAWVSRPFHLATTRSSIMTSCFSLVSCLYPAPATC